MEPRDYRAVFVAQRKPRDVKSPGVRSINPKRSLVIKLLRLVNGLARDLDAKLLEHVEVD